MPLINNIDTYSQVSAILAAYVDAYVLTDSYGAKLFSVVELHPGVKADTPKATINIWDISIEDFPQGSSICNERISVSAKITVRRLEKALKSSKYNEQAGRIRALFSGQGASLNTFSGTYENAPFTNQLLSNFGIFDTRVRTTSQAYSDNDSYITINVAFYIEFQRQYNIA